MVLREMLVDDLDQVMKIENELFSPPWTKEGFFTYLTRKDAMFLVVEEKGEILAYCGLIMVLDEGDITNVAPGQAERGDWAFPYGQSDPACRTAGSYHDPS